MEQHTPGPWVAHGHMIGDTLRWFIQRSPSVTIASLNSPCVMYSNAEADARLIAAAPELLAALEELVARCDGAEGVRADGSNIQTMRAHAVLEAVSGTLPDNAEAKSTNS